MNMPNNRKQHYVPQFYLRNFSQDQKQIAVYHLDSRKSFLSPISSTCQDKYFYDKDPAFEEFLSKFEPRQAVVIKKIIDSQSVEGLTSDDLYGLYSFIMLQFTRTKDAKILTENYVDLFVSEFIKPLMKADNELKKAYSQGYIDSLKITIPIFYKWTLGHALSNVDGISDLRIYLVVNKTKKSLISSDSPVIKNNYYSIKNAVLTGFQSPGLQIICPLTENILLLFVDPDAYKIIGSKDFIIEITKESDIDTFNKLQILNSLEILFINDQKNTVNVHKLFAETAVLKTQKKYVTKSIQTQRKPDGRYDEVVATYIEGINYAMHFSFLKMNHDYNRRKFKGEYRALIKTPAIYKLCRSDDLAKRMQYRSHHFFNLIQNHTEKKWVFDRATL